jgi:hypothetical protein
LARSVAARTSQSSAPCFRASDKLVSSKRPEAVRSPVKRARSLGISASHQRSFVVSTSWAARCSKAWALSRSPWISIDSIPNLLSWAPIQGVLIVQWILCGLTSTGPPLRAKAGRADYPPSGGLDLGMLDHDGRRRLLYNVVTLLEPHASAALIQDYVARRHDLTLPLLRIYVDLERPRRRRSSDPPHQAAAWGGRHDLFLGNAWLGPRRA